LAPLNLLGRIDALFGKVDREEVLRRARLIADPDSLAAERFKTVDIRSLGAEEPDAAAVHTGGDPNIEPCSSGLSQRRANPKPASALPVAIASSN
jgi:hypothetical protein